MRLFYAGVMLALVSTPAMACSVRSEAATRKISDVVVTGTGSFNFAAATGIIRATHIEKGARKRIFAVRWVPQSDQGRECPQWQPLYKRETGRYFLARNGDGTFSIISQDQRAGIQN